MSLRARYWTLVAAWFVVPPLLVLGALAVSPLCRVLLVAVPIGSHVYISRTFRCPACGTRLRLVRPARAWPPRHPGFAFDTHCHRCRHDLSSEGRRA